MTTRCKLSLVRDVMTRGVVTVSITAKIKDVADLMARHDLSGIAVTGSHGEIIGIISNIDILKIFDKENWENITIESIMTPYIREIDPTDTLTDAAKVMNDHHIHRLLIMSETGVGASQRPIGIISASDIVKEIAKT